MLFETWQHPGDNRHQDICNRPVFTALIKTTPQVQLFSIFLVFYLEIQSRLVSTVLQIITYPSVTFATGCLVSPQAPLWLFWTYGFFASDFVYY